MQYRIWFVERGSLSQGAWWPFDNDEIDGHILAFFENYPGEFYDIEIEEN